MKERLEMTPLQKVVGFDVAESTYDLLPFNAQIMLDLLIEGYSQQEIADVLNVSQSTVSDTLRRSRYLLAKSKLKLVLETRIYYSETHKTVVNEN